MVVVAMAIDILFDDENHARDKLAHGILPEIDYSDLEFYECLSTGTYGAVYRSKWISRNKVVAVKRLLVLEKEAHVLSVLRHKNIIQFYGAVTKAPNFCIVTEFAENGSLYSFLVDKNNADLTFSQIVRWSIDIASGVNYLHNEAPVKIVHRDLKSKNVVISSDDLCKLCDFGTSKPIAHSAQMSVVGTVPWMSPEMIQSLSVSESTDTWSYAVVLWEMCTREIPFRNLDAFRIAWMVVEENVRLPIPSSCPPQFADLMRACWNVDSKKRPSFREILKILQEIETDADFSAHADAYFKRKAQSKIEIDEQIELLKVKERELSAKETKLSELENRLRRREQSIELERARRSVDLNTYSMVTCDVNSWDEEEVILWLLHNSPADDDINFERLNELATTFRQNHITGSRLFMLTDKDLCHLGVDSQGYRRQILSEIGRLYVENERFINFPTLAYSAATSNRSRVSSFNDRKINITLLFGVYIRQGSSLGTQKWKILMDVDDDAMYDNIESLIDEVRYVVDEAPYVYKVSHTPFVMREWAVGFTCPTIQIQCIVTFSDRVRKPRNAKLAFDFDYDKRGLLFEKNVELYVKVTPNDTAVTTAVAISTPLRAQRSNSWYTNSTTTTTTNVVVVDAPIINLQGAWLEKAFERSVSLVASPTQQNFGKTSPLSFVSRRSSSNTKTSRQVSEEIRAIASNVVTPQPQFFIEGALSFDDDTTIPKMTSSVDKNHVNSIKNLSNFDYTNNCNNTIVITNNNTIVNNTCNNNNQRSDDCLNNGLRALNLDDLIPVPSTNSKLKKRSKRAKRAALQRQKSSNDSPNNDDIFSKKNRRFSSVDESDLEKTNFNDEQTATVKLVEIDEKRPLTKCYDLQKRRSTYPLNCNYADELLQGKNNLLTSSSSSLVSVDVHGGNLKWKWKN